MKNKKVIVINGFQRGGTNMVYNIFQSHPLVCSPNDLETGQILSQSYRIRSHRKIGFINKRIKLSFYKLLNKKIVLNTFIAKIFGIIIDELLYKYKLKNYTNKYNRFKYENIPYTLEEIKNSVLCLKSIHFEIQLSKFFSKIYDDIFFIGLVRNGYALCEGWIRRGKSAKINGERYRTFCNLMINDSKKLKNYIIVKFEDILKDPFNEATKLFKFTHLEPNSLKKLRFKSKEILRGDGIHKVKYGKLDSKYWFDHETIKQIIEPNINNVQIQDLSEKDKIIFEQETKPILKYFNYLE